MVSFQHLVALGVIAAGLSLTQPGGAQTIPASNLPVSYVASVKENKSPEARAIIEYFPGGRLSATAMTVRGLLRTAYRVQDYQLVGAPAWFSSKRYDIVAKVDDNPPPKQQEFLKMLLADRFGLVVHQETRESPIFALVVARGDKKLGPQLTPSDFDCAAYRATPHGLPDGAKAPPCGARANMGAFSGRAIPIPQLATSISAFVGRLTIDKTALAGRYDVELTWVPDPTQSESAADPPPQGPSVFGALQEQLGLKLVPEKGPVEVFVVDRAKEPSEN